MSLALIFITILPFLSSQEVLPTLLTSCSGKQLANSQCGGNPCSDNRCLTCSATSPADCLVCDSNYSVSRLAVGWGSCVTACDHTSLQTEHFNNTAESTFKGTEDTCSSSNKSQCDDPRCLSCLDGKPGLCLVCEQGFYPRYNDKALATTCTACNTSILNCSLCSWSSYCFKCQEGNNNNAEGGFMLSENGVGCTACNKAFPKCGRCDGIHTCVACDKGFYLNAGKCAACLRNCDICSDKKICMGCKTDRKSVV